MNSRQYLRAVLAMSGLGVIGVVLLAYLRPSMDVVLIVGAVFGALAPTTLALLAYMKAQETHLSVNSRLDAWIETAGKIARAEGEVAGRREAEHRADQLLERDKS